MEVRIRGYWTRQVQRGSTYTNANPATVSNEMMIDVRGSSGVTLQVKYADLGPLDLFADNKDAGTSTYTATWNYYAKYNNSSFSNKIKTESRSGTIKYVYKVPSSWTSGNTVLSTVTRYDPLHSGVLIDFYEVRGTLTATTTKTESSRTSNSYTFPTTQEYWDTINGGKDNGYVVSSWKTTNSAYSDKSYTPGSTVNSSRDGTFNWYPVLKGNTYKITLNYNYSGAPQDGSINVTYKEKCSNLTTPSRANYTFKGWTTNADGSGDSYTKDTVYNIIGNLTLYAQWKGEPHWLNVDCNFESNSSDTKHYKKAFVTLPYSRYEGVDKGNNAGESDWYIVKKTVNTDSDVSSLPTASLVDYKFLGWYTSRDGGTKVETTHKMPASDLTIYAHWERNNRIIFDCNGGSKPNDPFPVKAGDFTKIYRDVAYNETSYNQMNAPVREGFVFDGWCTENGTEIYEYIPNWNRPNVGITPTVIAVPSTNGYWGDGSWKKSEDSDGNILLGGSGPKWTNTQFSGTLYARWRGYGSYAVYNGTWKPIIEMYALKDGAWKKAYFRALYSGNWKEEID